MNSRLNFGDNPGHRLDTGIVFRIRCYWEIRKVVINGHKSAVNTESPDDGTGKTYLGGGMHYPSACTLFIYLYNLRAQLQGTGSLSEFYVKNLSKE